MDRIKKRKVEKWNHLRSQKNRGNSEERRKNKMTMARTCSKGGQQQMAKNNNRIEAKGWRRQKGRPRLRPRDHCNNDMDN